MENSNHQTNLKDRYNESVKIPPEISTSIPAIPTPTSPPPSSENLKHARSQAFISVLVLSLFFLILLIVVVIFVLIST